MEGSQSFGEPDWRWVLEDNFETYGAGLRAQAFEAGRQVAGGGGQGGEAEQGGQGEAEGLHARHCATVRGNRRATAVDAMLRAGQEGMPMLKVHHLNNSRSQRVLWLLEELGVPYEVKRYARDPKTMLAPPALREIHPLGKSPLLEVARGVIQESGAIVQYLCERHGRGKWLPAAGTDDALRHNELMHFAEGSAMTPVLAA